MYYIALILTALLSGCATRQLIPTRSTPSPAPVASPAPRQAPITGRECDECENPHYRPPGTLFMHLRGSGKSGEVVGYHLYVEKKSGFTLCPLYFEHRATNNPEHGYFGNCVPLGKLTHYRKKQGQWLVLFEDGLHERVVCAPQITCKIGLGQDPESYAACVALPKPCTPLITSPWPKLEDWSALPFDLF